MRIIVDKPCQKCGVMMLSVSQNKLYCDECVRLRNLAVMAAYRKSKKEESQQNANAHQNELSNVANAALNAGISYGKYVSSLNNK